MIGHFFCLFTNFVLNWGFCPYNFEKIWPDFLESAANRCNFASEIRNNKFHHKLVRVSFSFSYFGF